MWQPYKNFTVYFLPWILIGHAFFFVKYHLANLWLSYNIVLMEKYSLLYGTYLGIICRRTLLVNSEASVQLLDGHCRRQNDAKFEAINTTPHCCWSRSRRVVHGIKWHFMHISLLKIATQTLSRVQGRTERLTYRHLEHTKALSLSAAFMTDVLILC